MLRHLVTLRKGYGIVGVEQVDLRQLHYFVHVAKLKSFSRAAAHLNVAQSALSRHMRLLESELEVRLLDRNFRGTEPTAAGEILLKRATRLLQLLDETRQEVMSVGQGPAGHVKLAVPPSVSQNFAAPLIEACGHELPNVTLILSEGWTGDIHEWLLTGHSDLGIIYSSQVDDRVSFKPISSENLQLIMSANTKQKRQKSYTLREVSEIPLIVPPLPHGLRKVIDSAFAENDLTPKIARESQVWSVIKELVKADIAQAIFTSSEVAADIRRGRMVSVPIVGPAVPRTIGVAMAHENRPPPAVKAVYDLVSRSGSKWCSRV